VLPRFAEDFHWLANQGIAVERFNLSQQPNEFAGNVIVRETLGKEGTACLPLILVNGNIVSRGRYPERDELVQLTGLSAKASGAPFVIADGCKPGSGCC
jgi:hypothetical protein